MQRNKLCSIHEIQSPGEPNRPGTLVDAWLQQVTDIYKSPSSWTNVQEYLQQASSPLIPQWCDQGASHQQTRPPINPFKSTHGTTPDLVMDITDLLSGTLGNLRLSNDSTQNQEPSFSPYSKLPSELRLKVLEHALPPPTTLPLKAHILISDPSFGLYITFSISPSGPYTSFEPKPMPHHLTTTLQQTRMTNLLLTTKETRAFYLSTYPLSLPSLNAKSQIRFSPLETVFIVNFPDLLKSHDFCTAIQNEYRLQDWWTRIELLAVPFLSFAAKQKGHYSPTLLKTTRKLEGLKVFNAVVWSGFTSSNLDREGMRSLKECMWSQLREMESDLRETFARDIGGGGYCVARFGFLDE